MSWPHRIFANQFTDLELKLLRVFRTVVDCGGFSPAEIEIGMTKSAISKHVSDLEIRLGVRLCERGRSGFALTPEGRLVYDATMQLLVAIEEFRSKINAFHSDLVGEFYVGFIDNVVTSEDPLLLQILSDYVQTHRALSLKLIVGSAAEIDRAIEERRLHIGISVAGDESSKIVSTPLSTETSFLYCGRRHELFALEDSQISDEQLASCSLVQHGYSVAEQQLVKRFNLTAKATAHQTEGVLFLILAGQHVGFLPDHYAKAWVARGDIRAIRPKEINKASGIVIKANSESRHNPMVESFLDITRKHSREWKAG